MAADLPPAAEKATSRAAALGRRDALPPAHREAASRAIAAAALPAVTAAIGVGFAPVSAYWPVRSEVDPRPLLAALAEIGTVLALPTVTAGGLVFRRWRPGDPLQSRPFGLSEPLDTAEIVQPRLVLAPLAAFDRKGNRIGYGKGHYDRALARLAGLQSVRVFGLAFACQELPSVAAEAHDWRLDAIFTEAGQVC